MSEASTTEDPATSEPKAEPAAAEQTEQNDIPKSEETANSEAKEISESSAAEPTDANNEATDASADSADNDTPSTPSNEESADSDDWAAAMAEQATVTNDVAKNEHPPKEETAPVFEQFSKEGGLANAKNDIDMILDIPVQLTVELGRTKIAIKNLMQLAQGSVVELDGMAGEPMDVLVNGCLIAQGEVVVVNDKFGVRLTDIITPSERIRKLNR